MKCFLRIEEVLSKDLVIKYNDSQLLQLFLSNPNSLVLSCLYAEYDIPMNFNFEYIINVEEKTIIQLSKFKLSYVSAWSRPIDLIPLGYRTVCLMDFKEGDNQKMINIFEDKNHERVYISNVDEFPPHYVV